MAHSAGAGLDRTPHEPLLRTQAVSKSYVRSGLWQKTQPVQALSDVTLEIQAGSTTAIVGESGSGKSTLAMCIAGLEKPDRGHIWFKSKLLTGLDPAEILPLRQKIQLIFQGSATAFNPRFSALEITSEPLDIAGSLTRHARRELALDCMRLTGLGSELAPRSPLALSGGQRQRLAIARALTLSPELMIFDESFSGIDLLLEAQIVELLRTLKISKGLTYVVITHDLSLAASLAEHVAVMQAGHVVEQGLVAAVFSHPQHAHTQALLAAMPKWDIAQVAGSGA